MRFIVAGAIVLSACARSGTGTTITPEGTPVAAAPAPAPAPERWLGLLGEYDTPLGMRVVLEANGQLVVADTMRHSAPLTERPTMNFSIDSADARRLFGRSANTIIFTGVTAGRATRMLVGDAVMPRRQIEPLPGTNQLRITPRRPVAELRVEALAASPPREQGTFRAPDLVELTTLDPTIRLEIRYATTNNFVGTRFYDEARAFMQRPAAEALVRAHQSLRPLGFGLLIHDAYRPWYVTKMFWDATPDDKRWLVADPSQGSRHNRGEAVDLTLFELKTGQPVEMPSTYDESTDRAFADYPGGTSVQRWRRAVLRKAMEAQGYTVNPSEWWHFDYKDWREYPIGNVTFDKLRGR